MLRMRPEQMQVFRDRARVTAIEELGDWLRGCYSSAELGADLDARLAAVVGEAEELGLVSRADVYLYADLRLVHGFALREDSDLVRICKDEQGSPQVRMLTFVAAKPPAFWHASRLFRARMARP